ncbi:MAG: hypothetical protein QM813_09345 [Verrucomicrobiota bacterium]
MPASAPKIGELGYKFVHPVESVEGQDERRKHDTLRKAGRREAAKAVAATLDRPAPLPPVTTLLPGQPTPPAGDPSSGVPGPALTPGDEPPAVPWKPELLTDLVSELLDAAEEGRVGQFVAKCEEAGITGKLLKEIETDARFPKLAKIMLKRSLPRLAAKWLNRSGVSAEYQDELEVVTALLLMVQSDRKNSAKLDELIEQRRQEAKKRETPPTPAEPALVPA